jgi:hypothetical protein
MGRNSSVPFQNVKELDAFSPGEAVISIRVVFIATGRGWARAEEAKRKHSTARKMDRTDVATKATN